MKNRTKDKLSCMLVLFLAVLFLGGIIFGVIMPIIVSSYNKTHNSENECTVMNVDKKSGPTSISGQRLEVATKECGTFEMSKSSDGKSVNDLDDYIQPGKKYKFEFGDMQYWKSNKRAQNLVSG